MLSSEAVLHPDYRWRECFRTTTRVLILESGELKEKPHFNQLNIVESIGEPKSAAQMQNGSSLSPTIVRHGRTNLKGLGRCRVLGGSSHVWAAGKSTVFDDIDFTKR